MKTSIIILTYNKLEYTKICIDSIRKFTRKDDYEIIVVDNNSTDGTVEWIKEQDDIISILNFENLGFPKGCNQGIEIASGENVLLLNNDTIVASNWLENLNRALYSDDTIGMVGAVTNSCPNYQTIKVDLKDFNEINEFTKRYNISNPDMWEERLRLIGFCLLIKREIIEKVGLLDEMYTPGNFEDDDYSFRVRKSGYKLILCKDTFIYHFGHTSFSENFKFGELLKINRIKFANKWGFDAYYIADIDRDLKIMIEEDENSEFNLLQVGCNGGATLLDIKNKFKSANLYGIENQQKCITNKELFAKIQVGDLSALENYNKAFFDYIVINHDKNLVSSIKIIQQYLKNIGQIIIRFEIDEFDEKYVDLIKCEISEAICKQLSLKDKVYLKVFIKSELDSAVKSTI